MKTCKFWLVAMVGLMAVIGGVEVKGGNETSRPNILNIRTEGDVVLVTVQVPSGVRKVTLESRTRLGQGAWVPRAVHRLAGSGGEVTFRLQKSAALELLRVRGDAEEPLPLSFYTGKQEFSGPASAVRSVGGPWASLGAGLEDAAAPGAAEGGGRAVVESDIWRLRGDTLYFFNQYRGLQVLDLRQPDAPLVQSTLPLAASGEQMYVVTDTAGADFPVLLARNGCGWDAGDESRIIVIDPAGAGGPRIAATVPVPGTIVESRLVGDALYLATQTYRRTSLPPRAGSDEPVEQWEYGTAITAVDLSQPTAPQARGQLWFAGYGGVVHATDRFLFLVTSGPSDWWQSTVQLVDISAADGAMKASGSVRPAGRVADKFKLNLSGDVLTVISEVARWSPSGRQVSVLETFSLEDPQAPAKLGQLEVGHGEGLYATRFDGDRAYLVTFLRIDPLWVVDLRDPAQPKVSGELEVPGWSTYIHPLGDRLVTVGIDNVNSWRVAVSLFDVKDPARPGLLAKVPLGENHSWSEANQDEKAFTVLPEAGLILVPYEGWSEGGQVSRVQLIDLTADTLKARGVIEHSMQPRRATARGDRVFSVSGREFLSVDAADRDQPKVAAALELSWPVDRVLPVNGHLLEIAGTGSGYGTAVLPAVRVARSSRPDEALRRVLLAEGMPVLGAAVAEGVLCVVQSDAWTFVPPTEDGTPATEPTTRLRIATFTLADLPDLKPAGTATVEVAQLDWGTQFQALWVRPGLLVLAGQGSGFGWWRGLPAGGMLTDAFMPGWWWPGGGDARLIAIDVTDAATPRLLSDLRLPAKDGWWNSGDVQTAQGLLFLNHQANEFFEGVLLPGQPPPEPYEITHPDGTREKVTPPIGVWITRHFLDVVDYADPTSPTVRPTVNLPGRLLGVDAGGNLLFTTGSHWDAQGQSDGAEYVDGSAYDGVSVSQVASLRLPAEWPRAVAVGGGDVFVARPLPAPATGGLIEAWRLDPTGAFAKVAEASSTPAASQLKTLGSLVLAQAGASVRVFQYASRNRLEPASESIGTGCFWPDLSQAIVEPGMAVWLPLADYGLLGVPLTLAP